MRSASRQAEWTARRASLMAEAARSADEIADTITGVATAAQETTAHVADSCHAGEVATATAHRFDEVLRSFVV